MKISNVISIFDNGDFITLVTKNGAIHLPSGIHSLTIGYMGDEHPETIDFASCDHYVSIDFNAE